jgi:hypothetical protein
MTSSMKHGARLLAMVLGVAMVLGACGHGTKKVALSNGRILAAIDLPDMRLRTSPQLVPDPGAFVGALSQGDAVLFKEPAKAVPMIRANGFARSVLEDFTGPCTFAGAFAVEFASTQKATTALDAMYQDALQPCPNDPVCSIQHVFSVSDIPGSKGQNVTPYRKFGRSFSQYRVLFQVGATVYGVAIGGSPESFDPGSVSQAEAFKAFRALYSRVKKGPPAGLFAPTPMPS